MLNFPVLRFDHGETIDMLRASVQQFAAAEIALTHQQFRYRTMLRLIEAAPTIALPALRTEDPAIRPMIQYTLEHFLS